MVKYPKAQTILIGKLIQEGDEAAIELAEEKFEASEVFKDDLTDDQIGNLANYFVALPSEIAMKLWTVLGDSDNINNVVALHKAETGEGTRVSDHLVEILGGNSDAS